MCATHTQLAGALPLDPKRDCGSGKKRSWRLGAAPKAPQGPSSPPDAPEAHTSLDNEIGGD